MSGNKRYCMGCMALIDEGAAICPNCNYAVDTPQKSPYLSQGSKIGGRYLVGKTLSMANDSITYIGLDTQNGNIVTICEYYPNKISHRANGISSVTALNGYDELYNSCRQSFLGLWRGIRMFDEIRCIPAVLDIVDDNNTSYSICEYRECMPLKNYFEKTRKPLTYSKAVATFIPVLNALKMLHSAGIVHGGITPSTIQVGTDGRLVLTGFSIPQCRSDIRELASKPVNGFSPLEIYELSPAKPESDIYSITAVMYYAITGTVLPSATRRTTNDNMTVPSAVAQTIPKNVLEAIYRGLAVYPQNRISSAEELIRCLKSAPSDNIKTTESKNKVMARTNNTAPRKTNSQQKRPAQSNTQARKSPAKIAPSKQSQKGSEPPVFALGIAAFVAAVLLISVIFCALYTTVLYKHVSIPVLNDAFSSMSFLPMNQDNHKDEPDDVIATTEEIVPTVSETSYATVADFTKLTYDYIISNDSFQRNFVFKFKEQASDTVEKGGIISQNATAGESVPVGTEIVLVVSTGIEQIVVPDVKGKTYDEAKKIIEDAKLKATKKLLENTENKTPDEVYSMSIEPGQSVDKGTLIELGVWDKVPETTTEATTKEETTTKKPSSSKPDSTKPSTTKPTTTKPTTTKPTTTKPTTTKPTTTKPKTTASTTKANNQ